MAIDPHPLVVSCHLGPTASRRLGAEFGWCPRFLEGTMRSRAGKRTSRGCAAIVRAKTRFKSALLRAVFRSLRLVPAPVYAWMKRMPVMRESSRRLLDATLPSSGLSVVTIKSGPIGGLDFELQPRRNKDMAVGRYETSLTRAIQDLLQKGDLCFDVGAHLGYVSLVMARSVGRSGKVVAFEPDPQLFDPLLRNTGRNIGELAPVVPLHAAAGRASGRSSFRHGTSSGTGHLDDSDGDFTVRVLSLDDAAELYGVPDLIKIDVEGAEVEALEGAKRVLAEGRSSLLVEAHSSDLEELCRAYLERYHYDVDHLDRARKATSHLLARPARR
ncbi:MAG TPA: FkbM family methyltransferase [Actinomycetota bacterium]|nr:FkbM family methyltransferase [Actinomycetota bacterium]